LQQAEGGLFCSARSREAAGKKELRATRTGAGFAFDRGYGDGEAASSEEALIGNQSIDAALSGDASIRVLDEVDQAQQFAMAKAIESGDPRLMQLAALEAGVALLRRLDAAHFDDQHAVRVTVDRARADIAYVEQRIPDRKKDPEIRQPRDGRQLELGQPSMSVRTLHSFSSGSGSPSLAEKLPSSAFECPLSSGTAD
jgi:hypothetical protein